MDAPTTLVWLRQDLRLEDHPALAEAARRGGPVLPLFIWEPAEEGEWPPGAASRRWLHRSLASLDLRLRGLGSRLLLRRGPAAETLAALARECGADAVHWTERWEPEARRRDQAAAETLRSSGLSVRSFDGSLLHDPERLLNRAGRPYQVFTPFYKALLSDLAPGPPLPAPKSLPAPRRWPSSLGLDELGLEPEPIGGAGRGAGLGGSWEPGEEGALKRLRAFLKQAIRGYPKDRDIPGVEGTSRLSPHLRWGEIGPRQIWRAAFSRVEGRRGASPGDGAERGPRLAQGVEAFLRQVAWREFAYHLLHHYPSSPVAPLRPAFAAMPWRDDEAGLEAWRRGRTGFPLVDAAMRELAAIGWMHNRARMIVASFLVKDLLLPWQAGASWFWDALADADLANNSLGWQWAAGCGADAAPYFRVFNPVGQGEKYDPEGAYVKRWLPELDRLPADLVHRPWEADAAALRAATLRLGEDYPRPILDHAMARRRALEALEIVKRAKYGDRDFG